ncbi:MAG: class I SAM-dependent methyltransferase, partial [Gemmatimonadaceae bacterium]
QHISDTARWVAIYRAMESERQDALFRDPYARRLAGVKGDEIVNTIKQGRSMAWAMIVRTQVMDEIIRAEIAGDRIDLVLNLAAGLDARPWRMELPPTLHWVDVDLPDILRYKLETLRGEPTHCSYEAVEADLRDADVRHALFTRIGRRTSRALVVTEGLLIYLGDEGVAALASDLNDVPTFARWLIDLASPRLLKMMSKSWGKSVSAANAPFRFAPASGTEFFKPYGWHELEFHSTMDESRRLNRQMKGARFWNLFGYLYPARLREQFRKMSGIVLLERT